MDTGFVARIGKPHHDRDVRDHEPRDPPPDEEPEADAETADDDREHRDEERHARLAHDDGARRGRSHPRGRCGSPTPAIARGRTRAPRPVCHQLYPRYSSVPHGAIAGRHERAPRTCRRRIAATAAHRHATMSASAVGRTNAARRRRGTRRHPASVEQREQAHDREADEERIRVHHRHHERRRHEREQHDGAIRGGVVAQPRGEVPEADRRDQPRDQRHHAPDEHGREPERRREGADHDRVSGEERDAALRGDAGARRDERRIPVAGDRRGTSHRPSGRGRIRTMPSISARSRAAATNVATRDSA